MPAKIPPLLSARELRQPAERRLQATVLWLALGICLSPVLVDLARHLVAEPWARYVLVFPPLFAICAVRESHPERSIRAGAALLGIGLVVALIAVAGGFVRFGRLALPLSVIGLCRAFGLTSLRTALLSLWWVPLPRLLIALPSPALESTWLYGITSFLGLFGAELGVQAGLVRSGHGVLALSETDGGLLLAALLSGLGWLTSAWLGEDLWRGARRVAVCAALAFPIQLVFLGLAVTSFLLGVSGEFLEGALQQLWMGVALAFLLLACRRARALEVDPQ